jgi:hypothetical protein
VLVLRDTTLHIDNILDIPDIPEVSIATLIVNTYSGVALKKQNKKFEELVLIMLSLFKPGQEHQQYHLVCYKNDIG